MALTGLMVDNVPVRAGRLPAGVGLDGPISQARELILPWRHAVFSLEFAALHFADPARNRYAYRLEGFDRGWVETGADKRFATYTNLDPGRYTFRVKASNKDGVWNGEGVALAITITPPYWKTWWFRVTAAALLLAMGAAAYRLRVRSLVRRQVLLEREVVQRTAEVVRQKEQLAEALGELRRAQDQLVLNEKMASLGTLSAGVAHEINNPTNFAHAGARVLEIELEAFRAYLTALAGPDADGDVMGGLHAQIDALRERAATILEGTTRIRTLVADLRTFSRPDAAQRRTMPVGAILRSTVQLVRTRYAQAAVIECDLTADPPLACWPAQLGQVFMNLVVNACQAIEARRAGGDDPGPGLLAIRSRADAQFLYRNSRTAAVASPRLPSAGSTTPSSAPSRPAKAPGSDCRFRSGSSSATAAACACARRWARVPASRCSCRWRRLEGPDAAPCAYCSV
ncbi:hypothetical protein G4G28_12020 [Massilia sp. Dwa41.01b]|nr:triple tyrosine motif-containing protein [Massilia sp. Dwa41.01b]QNA89024.1 hypothetical protein G4G28_12020 [Massilia sp. Dwa41.01b]